MLVTRSLDLRYAGQNYEITLPFGDGGVPALRVAFEQRHRQLYGYATGESVECVNLRVAAIGGDDWAAAVPSEAPACADRPRCRRDRIARSFPRQARSCCPATTVRRCPSASGSQGQP